MQTRNDNACGETLPLLRVDVLVRTERDRPEVVFAAGIAQTKGIPSCGRLKRARSQFWEDSMEDRQFDAWSKTLARRGSRRQALKAGGTGAALLGMLGLRGTTSSLAQDDDAPGTATPTATAGDGACRMQFEADVRVGPSAASANTNRLSGELVFTPGDNGGINGGTFTTGDGTSYPVTGQSSGRSISLRIQIGDKTLVAVGVGDHNVRSCQGEYGGPATGPVRGDLGDWFATAEAAPPATPSAGSGAVTPTAGAGATTQAQSQPTASTGGGASGTSTATPCDLTCTDPLVVDPDSCSCVCPNGLLVCGAVCCPVGSVCNDPASGNCSCPSGTELCGDTCVACPDGQMVDFNSCACVSDPCPGGALCGTVCVDIVNDRNNCGSCGNECSTGVPCIAGSCSCPPGYTTCPTGCADLASDLSNCGVCGAVCGGTCSGGKCI